MFLSSSILQLRAPEMSDLDFMFHVENDTRLWGVSARKVPYSRYLLQQYIETCQHDIYADRQLRFMIERQVDGSVVGIVDLFDYDPSNHRAELGLVIDSAYRSQGYGHEAMLVLIEYAREVLDLHQLYAYIFVENTSACMLYRKLGFSEAGHLSDWVYTGGRYRDVILFQYLLKK